MAIFNLFRENTPVLMRCTYCYDEFECSYKEIRLIQKHNTNDPVCSIKTECPICHIGFIIPVKYTDKKVNSFVYSKIKPKIKNLDPNTVMERIFEHSEPENIFFFGPDD